MHVLSFILLVALDPAWAQEAVPTSKSHSVFQLGGLKTRAASSECYVDCFDEAVAVSLCDPSDNACTCADSSLIQRTSNCVLVNCSLSELLDWQKRRADACDLPTQNLSTAFLAVEWCLFSLAIAAVILRVIARLHYSTGLGWDDFLIFVALAPLITTTICQTIAFRTGLGRDIWAITFSDLRTSMLVRECHFH
ncbi:hypothetical protein EJ03DRAFT_103115 [Teratosphaeria nubilosa]|uniref:Uncharacterized protein n=1 Tax=Teratosphaeria nubilosa TaxID=161662 RepID=A0A6G1LLB8_9PEZI|nr:hypothetical protein EJ03DRAFT_103115 [Teratosphaeria nubilosa]